MKLFARLVSLAAIAVNVTVGIIDIVSGAWIMAILSFLIVCVIIAFSVKIKLWTKEPWVINER